MLRPFPIDRKTLMNKRLYAIILLATLALLQVRLAFAACELPPHDSSSSSGCDYNGVAVSVSSNNEPAVLCPPSFCVQQFSKTDTRFTASSFEGWYLPEPPAPATTAAPTTQPPPHKAAAHPAHTRLIYVLNRLLI